MSSSRRTPVIATESLPTQHPPRLRPSILSFGLCTTGRRIPTIAFPQISSPIPSEANVLMQQRAYLEKQGQLLRKEFMLRDRHNWPDVKFVANMPMAGPQRQYYTAMQLGAMGRQQQYHQQHSMAAAGGPPASKRMRQVPPQHAGAAAFPGMAHAAGIELGQEDDENHALDFHALGDSLDHLQPRVVSWQRYKQHHEWIEEMLASGP